MARLILLTRASAESCAYCFKPIAASDNVVEVLGVSVHSECRAARTAKKAEPGKVVNNEPALCSFCHKEVHAAQERIFLKGVENHRECYARANYVQDKVATIAELEMHCIHRARAY